jgi:hypothetical protein
MADPWSDIYPADSTVPADPANALDKKIPKSGAADDENADPED